MESFYLIIYLVIEIAGRRGVEIEMFTGMNFEMWKLEDIMVDCDMLVVVFENKPPGRKQEDLVLTYQNAKGLIRLRTADSILLNIHDEKIAHSLGKKLRDIYQGKSLVNKLFLRNKLYSLKMDGGTAMVYHLNMFNMVITQLTSIIVSISEEEFCILLLYLLLESWDHLVMAIRSTTT